MAKTHAFINTPCANSSSYWFLASVASYLALHQLFFNPSKLEKTEHGISNVFAGQVSNKQNEPTPRTEVRGFGAAGIIWLSHDYCSRIYLRMISSFTVPTVSAKYPSAQKLSPQRNSSSSGYSFLITLLVPPLRIFTASATLSDALSWMIR